MEIAKTCRGYGVNDIFISSIICRRNKFLNEKFQHVNFLLKLIYEENGYLYTLKMEIIKVGDLWKNVSIFQNMKKVNYLGIIYIFKRFLHKLQTSFHIIFFKKLLHTNLGLRFSQSNLQVLNTNDCESIPTTDILNSSASENETSGLKLRLKNAERFIIDQVNIILLRNKFRLLKEIIRPKLT